MTEELPSSEQRMSVPCARINFVPGKAMRGLICCLQNMQKAISASECSQMGVMFEMQLPWPSAWSICIVQEQTPIKWAEQKVVAAVAMPQAWDPGTIAPGFDHDNPLKAGCANRLLALPLTPALIADTV